MTSSVGGHPGSVWFGVGVDVGTTNTKVVGVRVDPDRFPAGPEVRFTLETPTPDDAGELDRVVRRLLAEAAERLPGPAGVIGIASMAETGIPLDAEYAPLTPLIRWQDVDRTADANALAATVGADVLIAATGVRIGPKPPLVMWHWLRRCRPDLFGRMRHWAGVADWVHHRLTGRLVTDHTLAGRTGAYRLGSADHAPPAGFDPDLTALAGVRVEQLPRVRAREEPLAGLTDATLVAVGYRSGTPVMVCGHDHQVAAWAAGVRQPGQTADSVGTAEAVFTLMNHWPDPAAVAAQGMSLVRSVGGSAALLGGSSAAGGFLQWFADTYAGGDVAACFADVDPEPSTSIVLPYLTGRQCPSPDPDALPVVIGSPHASAAVHGVAYQAAWMARTQAELVGVEPDELVMIGEPMRRNLGWAAVKAALAPGPARVVDCEQPVAAGAAVLAGVTAGTIDPDTTLDTTPAVSHDRRTRQAHAGGLRRFVEAATSRSNAQ